jgi:hypothetical protein
MGVMTAHVDWRLRDGIASPTNFAVLLVALLTFPLVLRWTGALSVAGIDPQSPQHTRAFLKFCFVLTAFSWIYFAIAFVGIRRSGRVTWQEVVGAKWHSWQAISCDLARYRPGHLCDDGSDRKPLQFGPGTAPAR